MKCLAVSLIMVVGIAGAACSHSDPLSPPEALCTLERPFSIRWAFLLVNQNKSMSQCIREPPSWISEGIFAGTPILVSKVNGNAATAGAATVNVGAR